MASSKIITNNSATNQELPRQPSLHSSLSTFLADFQNHQPPPLQPNQSMNMEDLFKTIYSSPQIDTETDAQPPFIGASIPREDAVVDKALDPVWKGVAAGAPEKITLEEFLMTKTGADVDVGNQAGVYAPVDPVVINGGQFSGFVNNGGGGGQILAGPSGGGRGKRRAVEEPPVDKSTQQKQKRMIKNRESAARSRERKQAYTVELESLVTQLKEENAALLREEAEQTKKRFKQLMETLIPVDEKPRQPRTLGRMSSM